MSGACLATTKKMGSLAILKFKMVKFDVCGEPVVIIQRILH